MPRIENRTYSRHTREAVTLLGRLIRLARKERRLSAAELAERAGISRGTLQRIEKGDPKVEIGIMFEAATLVGEAGQKWLGAQGNGLGPDNLCP